MFNFINAFTKLLKIGAAERITDEQFVENEIRRFKTSRKRKAMFDGQNYYEGKHDILSRQRTVIGENGELEEVHNLPNNRIVDNQYKKMVNQKNNYLLGQPLSIQCDNEQYLNLLNQIINKRFLKLLKNVGQDALNCGMGWLFAYYDDLGQLAFKRMKPWEIIAGWQDDEHTILDYAIRLYEVVVYEGKKEKIVEKVEVYDDTGISYFELTDGGSLKAVEPYHQNYFSINEDEYNWSKIPLIPWKYNDEEIPLIKMVKSLQDGLNLIESNFQNNMEEDMRNTILVLVNYDGENLGNFRRNLATYGAVKVRTVDGAAGDVKTLQIEVNSENYKAIIELFKKAIIENAMGYDAKDDRLAGSPNQMNIMSMYNDIDLDANSMETEFQASFEELLWFINIHLFNTGNGDFEGEDVEIIFNRDMLQNESEIIANAAASVGLISNETIVANHPWVTDVQSELDRLEEQKQKEMEEYQNAFVQNPDVPPDDGGDE